MATNVCYRPITKNDWPVVANIYKQGIETGDATFQQEVPTWEEWDKGHLDFCRIIATVENEIVGWAALTAVSGRCVYAGVAEVSIYIAANYRGQNFGRKTLARLIEESEQNGIWTLNASIFKENISSIKIHQSLGFRNVGYREKIGKMKNVWRDTLLFERRSKITGS